MRKSNYINQSKRQFLRTGAASIAAGAIGTSGFFLPKTATASLPKIRSSAKIVIAGAGAAGLTIASQLAARLEPSAQIILGIRITGLKQGYKRPASISRTSVDMSAP